MSEPDGSIRSILDALQERAKELNCLYRVDEILNRQELSAPDVYLELIRALPAGWKYPRVCRVRISVEDEVHQPPGFKPTPWSLASDIVVEGEKIGAIEVFYSEKMPPADDGPFLKEERRLIDAIAERIGVSVMQRRLRRAHRSWNDVVHSLSSPDTKPWRVLLEFLRRAEPRLLSRITNKMIHHLCWNGIEEARPLLLKIQPEPSDSAALLDDNRPRQRQELGDLAALADQVFSLATRHFSEDQVMADVHNWMNEERSSFLISTLENQSAGLGEIVEALERYKSIGIDESLLPVAVRTSLNVSLLRRFFGDQLEFIHLAKDVVNVSDFHALSQHIVYPSRSRGKIGGKGGGLFLAEQILRRSPEYADALGVIKIPRTWYVASDAVIDFIQHNGLEDLYNRKYMPIERIRQDYPHVVQVFKNSHMPPEIAKGLSTVLDDLEGRPLIVRSSSLLEDRVGAAFSGKYRSIFVANQGTKRERLAELQDAIAEVYASIFGPDPIEYRAERNLLDFREEMGILIQEVVGQQVGRYFCSSFAGVAFSTNEFRWSPRIRREDGLMRLVPGLGTRAVDRMSDDYPVLIAPGQPGLRVNVTADEVIRYSPQEIDVINLDTSQFETIKVIDLLRESGDAYPLGRDMVSIIDHDRVRRPTGLEPDWETDDLVVTFDGLVARSTVISQIETILKLLQDRLGTPVDIEFASNGTDLYLVQCRAQSFSSERAPAPIPRDIPREKIVFFANRYVANGRIDDITHIVYVDPEEYAEIEELSILKEVGRAVGRLNQLLPKRQFILIGPGRWGSRGDIKLGVNVTYSDINNTAALMEIARKKGRYVPELSFGTHFFQDLVEAGIRYLPIYPDEPGMLLDETFFRRARNILPDLAPEFASLAATVRVIDVARETSGQHLRVLMNADLDEAVGILAEPGSQDLDEDSPEARVTGTGAGNHWRWRMRMAKRIGALIDVERLGVKNLYVFGSTKNATAGPASDIDLLIHVDGTEHQREELALWLDGWSRSLSEINYLRTGYQSDGLLDVHYVTDDDIARRTSYAAKINAVTDAARSIPIGSSGS